jgi:outer membrane protein
MTKTKFPLIALAAAAATLLPGTAALAQSNIAKAGAILYTTDSKTSGVSGVGVPPGADAETGDAWTLLLSYERMISPNVGVELVIGIPPTIKAKATGTVAYLGEDILSAKNVAPTLLVNYHFGKAGDTLRPYLGAGINYTKFASIKSKLAPDVKMSDSTGLAIQAGVDYALSKDWGLYASIAKVDVKSKLVASGTTVLTTEIDFRPITYSFGVAYRF